MLIETSGLRRSTILKFMLLLNGVNATNDRLQRELLHFLYAGGIGLVTTDFDGTCSDGDSIDLLLMALMKSASEV